VPKREKEEAVPYRSELSFLQRTFEKSHIRINIIDPQDFPGEELDLGLRKALGWDADYEESFGKSFAKAKANTIHRMTDPLGCRYMFFKLPERKKVNLVVIGPYFPAAVSYEQMLERAEKAKIPAAMAGRLQNYFDGLPVLSADNPLFSAIDVFAEHIWKGSYFEEDIGDDVHNEQFPTGLDWHDRYIHEIPQWSIHELEERYRQENELLHAVSMGQTHRAEQLAMGFSKQAFERRTTDPVRNMKNYCIVTNTMFRKAAERGSVHPFYLDRISSDFAREIEEITTTDAAVRLLAKMMRAYCRQVRKHNTHQYSLPVQNLILRIDSNLSGDLSLKTLAAAQNINASYLSSLFKKETGQTVTDYVNRRRVDMAKRLLESTKLQIQTIAQHCGMSDVNYFSKIFKKYTSKTPREYRTDNQRVKQTKDE